MKKKIASLAVIALAVTVSVIGYEYFLFEHLSAQLEEQSASIAEGYRQIAEENLPEIEKHNALTREQKESLNRIEHITSTMSGSVTLHERIQQISTLQTSLVSFIASVTSDQTVAKDASYIYLQKEMGERGEMRKLLQEYNNSAMRWNNAVQSDVGSLTGRVSGEERSLLPFLRFDGGQEFIRIVEL